MSTLKTHNLQSPDAGSVNVALAPNAGMVVSGISTFNSDVLIADKIIHTGDTNTAIRFPTNDTITFETSGIEKVRIQPNGRVGIGTDNPPDCTLTVCEFNSGTEIYDNIALRLQGSSGQNVAVQFTDTTGAAAYIAVQGDNLRLGTNNAERLRITSGGKIGINYAGTPPSEDVMICTAGQASPAGLSLSHLSGGNRYGARFQTISGTNQGISIFGFFNSSYTERVRINSTGHVTLGEANFTASNDVHLKRANAGGDVAIRITNNTSNDASTASLYFTTSPTQNFNTSYIQAKRDGGKLDFGYATNDPTVTMKVSTGDVGIGNDSPDCKLAIKDTTEFTAYGGGAPNSSNILLQLWNNPPNETANDHASMQFAVNGGTHNRVNTISAVAESASNRKLAFAFCTDEAGSRTEKMRISGDGYVTKPETPSWVLRPAYSSNQTLGSGTHAVGWSSSDYNTHAKAIRLKNVTLSGSGFTNNLHNGQTYGKIVVPVAGIYRVWCTIRMENNPRAGNLFLYVDGSQVVRQHVEMWNHQPYMHGRIEHIVNLNANSYIIWALNCNGGVVSGVQDTVNWCGGHLIG